ncbi:MAG: thioredoxin family protein [archaeon]|nr:thioredoxin family protein [archaeon]
MNSKSKSIANAGVQQNTVIKNIDVVIEQKESLTAEKASSIDWQPYEQGLKLAKEQSKPVFLYFHADWCKYCKKLKQITFADKTVLNYLSENFISITIDTEKEKDLALEWGIKGLPNLWFLRADNSKISNLPGYVGPEQFIIVLKYIRTKSYDKMSFSDFLKTI